MSEHPIKQSRRFAARKHSKALRDIYKIFTELITNSDESYNRLKKQGVSIEYSKDIKIYVDRKTRDIKIIDYAEGMDSEDIKNAFEKYGAIKSGVKKGHKGRGLYGQGLTDVLFLNPYSSSSLYSIKDNKLYKCSFYYKGDEQIYSDEVLGEKELERHRQEYGVLKNGTVIEFKLPEKINLPQFQNLVKGLTNAYMLRFINSNPERNIVLTETENGKKPVQERIKYNFVETIYSKDVSKVIDSQRTYFKYEDFKPVEIETSLYKANFDLKQEIGEDANGLLIFDANYDNCVYDLDLFGFEKELGANNIFGYIKLTNIREIIDQKLEEQIPEEILTDTRDGFDKSHQFYKIFSSQIKDLLAPIFNSLKNSGEDTSNESEETRRKHQQVFNYLNQKYIELVGKKEGGTFDNPDSSKIHNLVFARQNIKITEEKSYGLQLKININDFPQESEVFITCSEKRIMFSPEKINLSEEQVDEDGMISRYIYIKSNTSGIAGKLTAKCGDIEAVCFISIIQSELFYPKNGIEFNPDEFVAVTNKKSKLHLFVDLNKIKIGEEILLRSENYFIEIFDNKINVPEENISQSNNSMVQIDFIGKKNGEIGYIYASCGGYECKVKIYVSEKNQRPPQGKDAGIFRGWKFGDMPEQNQKALARYGEDEGFIVINRKNPINKIYFGDNPVRCDIDKSVIMQLYIAELILDEFLNLSVAEAYNKGNLGQQTDDPHTDISKHIEMEKLKIGPMIYDMFVSKPLHQRYQEIVKHSTESNDTNVLMSRINALDGRLKDIVEMKFGLNENRKHTLEEISLKYNLTRERIRQIINSALPKLYENDETITLEDVTKDESTLSKEKIEEGIDYIDRFEKSIDITTNKIIDTVANFYNIKTEYLKGVSRAKEVVVPRQVSMYLIRKHTKSSFPTIGEIFKKDHTTVLYAYNTVQEKYEKEEQTKKEITLIESNLMNIGILN